LPSATTPRPAPQEPHAAANPSATDTSPYDVVWVDGTQNGPASDFSTEPGSPPDYTVSAEPNAAPVDTTAEAPAVAAPVESTVEEPEAPASFQSEASAPAASEPAAVAPQSMPTGPAVDDTFSPDPGYVNPNWRPELATAAQPVQGTATTFSQPINTAAAEAAPAPSPSTNAAAQPGTQIPWSSQPVEPATALPVVSAVASPGTVPEAHLRAQHTGRMCRRKRSKKLKAIVNVG
jgi:hypothetical protein